MKNKLQNKMKVFILNQELQYLAAQNRVIQKYNIHTCFICIMNMHINIFGPGKQNCICQHHSFQNNCKI